MVFKFSKLNRSLNKYIIYLYIDNINLKRYEFMKYILVNILILYWNILEYIFFELSIYFFKIILINRLIDFNINIMIIYIFNNCF